MKIKIFIIAFVAVIAAEGMVLAGPDLSFVPNIFEKFNPWPGKSLAEYAQEVMQKCKEDAFAPNCYDREIPKLMDHISMEDAFKVTKLVQQQDQRYLYCHVLGHNLSYRETDKDPDKWMDVITRCPATMCNNGCLHGSMMRRYNSESLTDEQIEKLKPDVQNICEPRGKWHPTRIEQSMCYHAVGHLFMYITNANLDKAVSLCDWVGKKPDGRDYVQTCTEGVFMQVFQPLEAEDFALVADLTPKKEGVVSFCEPFKDRPIAWEACRRESWPLFRTELMNPAFMEKWCSFSDRQYAYKTCQAALMNFITVNFVVDMGNMDGLDKFCLGLKDEGHKRECYAYASSRLMQIDPIYTSKALDVCNLAETHKLGKECYELVAGYGTLTYLPGSKEYAAYCEKMPGEWKDFCNKVKNY